MAQQNLNHGTIPEDHTGEGIFYLWEKTQANFTELYSGSVLHELLFPFHYARNIPGIHADGVTSDSALLTAKIAEISAAGGGTLLFDALSYYTPTAIPAKPGVSIQGVAWTVNNSGAYVSGTRFIGDGTDNGLAWTAGIAGYSDHTKVTGDGTQPSLGNCTGQAVYGFQAIDCAFNNFANALKFGELYSSGCFRSAFKNILVEGATEWGVYFENSSQSRWENIRVVNNAAGYTGNMYFGASQTAYVHGNSFYDWLYATNSEQYTRGIVFQSRAGASFNQLTVLHIQDSQSGSSAVSDTITYSSGNELLAVADSSIYKLDEPIGSTDAFANGFYQYKTYFVRSIPDATHITISYKQRGTSIVPTGGAGATRTFKKYGFPCVEISGLDTDTDPDGTVSSQIQSIWMHSTDAEGYGGCNVLVQNAFVNIQIAAVLNALTGQGTSVLSHLTVRNSQGLWSAVYGLFTDIQGASTEGGAPFYCTGAYVSGWSAGRMPVGIFYDSARASHAMNFGDSSVDSEGSFINQKCSTTHFTYPGIGIGQRSYYSSSTTLSLNASYAGSMVFSGASDGTWTLPALVSGRGGSAVNVTAGMEFEVINNTAFNLFLDCAGTDKFDYSGGAKVRYTITQGKSIKVRASWISPSTVFWAVVANNGAT
jgi:hypothetical protein